MDTDILCISMAKSVLYCIVLLSNREIVGHISKMLWGFLFEINEAL